MHPWFVGLSCGVALGICRAVYNVSNLNTPLRYIGAVSGSSGAVAVPGTPATFWSLMRVCFTPWAPSHVLVVNSGIEPENVVEVDITTGLLVRELVTGVDGVTNVAATATMFAVSNFGATLSSLSQVKIYDVNGTLLASFGGTRLSDGETDYVGE